MDKDNNGAEGAGQQDGPPAPALLQFRQRCLGPRKAVKKTRDHEEKAMNWLMQHGGQDSHRKCAGMSKLCLSAAMQCTAGGSNQNCGFGGFAPLPPPNTRDWNHSAKPSFVTLNGPSRRFAHPER